MFLYLILQTMWYKECHPPSRAFQSVMGLRNGFCLFHQSLRARTRDWWNTQLKVVVINRIYPLVSFSFLFISFHFIFIFHLIFTISRLIPISCLLFPHCLHLVSLSHYFISISSSSRVISIALVLLSLFIVSDFTLFILFILLSYLSSHKAYL